MFTVFTTVKWRHLESRFHWQDKKVNLHENRSFQNSFPFKFIPSTFTCHKITFDLWIFKYICIDNLMTYSIMVWYII